MTELRTALTGRDADRQAQLNAATVERVTLERAHAEGLAQAQQRYETLSKQLLRKPPTNARRSH